MTSSSIQPDNIYLSGSIPTLFARTAAPIIIVMLVNGLHTIVDTYFLGAYVGADAVTAVTLMFPLYMMLIALSTLVSNGFSSIYARQIGAGDNAHARQVMVSAVQLAMLVCVVLATGFALLGGGITHWIANGNGELAGLGRTYMSILIYCSPLMFLLAVNVDALRAEGLLSAMATFTLLSALLNIAFDWLFVPVLGFGVPGSAWGTVLAQVVSFTCILIYRTRRGQWINPFGNQLIPKYWAALLSLGAPTSLGYVGLSLSAGLTLFALQIWAQDSFATTSGAFGISTRLMTFMFLPLLGLSMAFQTIAGNNYGAHRPERVRAIVLAALGMALIYTSSVEIGFYLSAPYLGGIFVDDVAIQQELARIIPIITLPLFVFGPLMIIGVYYQAIGRAGHAAILQLTRTYLFALPLTLLLPMLIGEVGIWYSGVVAETGMLVLALIITQRDGTLRMLMRGD